MSTQVKPAEPTPVPVPKAPTPTNFVFNVTACQQKFQKIEESVNKVVGKAGYNPFIWMKKNVESLAERFKKGERTPELQTLIIALPDEVPPLQLKKD